MCSGRFMQPPSLTQTAAIFLVAICCQTHSQDYADSKNLLHGIDGPHSRFEDDASIFLGRVFFCFQVWLLGFCGFRLFGFWLLDLDGFSFTSLWAFGLTLRFGFTWLLALVRFFAF
jgi:hypothetical protein